MGLINTAPVAETTWLADPTYDYPQLLAIRGYVTGTAIGTARLTLRWTDPFGGAQSRNFDMLVTGLGFPINQLVGFTQANGSTLTYEVTHLAVIGTPAYTFDVNLHT